MLKCFDKFSKTFPVVCLMSTENAVKGILAVVRDPGELSAVIIQKTRSKADPAACRYVCQSSLVIGAVKIADLPR